MKIIYGYIIKIKMTNYHYFINPKTKRVNKIKETSYKKFSKERCLYNKRSVKSCINKISKRYPNINAPLSLSTPFKTYPALHQLTPATAFIVLKNKICGFVNQAGHTFRFDNCLSIKGSFRKFPIVHGDFRQLKSLLRRSEHVYKDIELVEEQLKLTAIKNAHLIYNHLHNDFIPVYGYLTPVKISKILSLFEKKLVPITLPKYINSESISGIVVNGDKIIGYVSPDNSIHKFDIGVSIDTKLISKKILTDIPTIQIEDSILEQATTSPLNDFLSEIKLLDSIPQSDCFKYRLEWDPKYQQCRVKRGDPLLIEDHNNNIIGFSEN